MEDMSKKTFFKNIHKIKYFEQYMYMKLIINKNII